MSRYECLDIWLEETKERKKKRKKERKKERKKLKKKPQQKRQKPTFCYYSLKGFKKQLLLELSFPIVTLKVFEKGLQKTYLQNSSFH